MKTVSAKAEEQTRKWYVIDAKNQVVGHIAEKAAILLRGKAKPSYTPHIDNGDFVVVINAEQAVFTGKKEDQKLYTSYAQYIGNQKRELAKDVRRRQPTLLVERAVKGMIPHNRLGRSILKKLHVYAGNQHPHEAQEPQPVKLN